MPTAPNRTSESILADARAALHDAKRHAAKLRAAEKAGKAKLPGGYDDFVERLVADVASATEALDRAPSAALPVSSLDVTLKQRSGVLFNALRAVRDDVAKRRPNDEGLARAFDLVTPLDRESPSALLETTAAILAALEDPALRKSAADVGITTVRVQALAALRDSLAEVQAARGAHEASLDATRRSARLLASLEKLVAQWSAVAKRVVAPDAPAASAREEHAPPRKTKLAPAKAAKTAKPAKRRSARAA